jgi:hypothetical protein
MSGIWNHLKTNWEGSRAKLVEQIYEEKKHQEKLEEEGYRSPGQRGLYYEPFRR